MSSRPMTFAELSEQFKNKLETYPTGQVIKGLVDLFKHLRMKEEEIHALHYLLRYNSIQKNDSQNTESLTVLNNKFILSLLYWINEIGEFSSSIQLPENIDQFFPEETAETITIDQPYVDLIDYFKFRAKVIFETVQNSDQYYELISVLIRFRNLHESHISAIEKENLILAHEILRQIHNSGLWQSIVEKISKNLIYNTSKKIPKDLSGYYTSEIPPILLSAPSNSNIEESNAAQCYIEILSRMIDT